METDFIWNEGHDNPLLNPFRLLLSRELPFWKLLCLLLLRFSEGNGESELGHLELENSKIPDNGPDAIPAVEPNGGNSFLGKPMCSLRLLHLLHRILEHLVELLLEDLDWDQQVLPLEIGQPPPLLSVPSSYPKTVLVLIGALEQSSILSHLNSKTKQNRRQRKGQIL
jgi:hypothetical protein